MIILSSTIFGNNFLGKIINFNHPGAIQLPEWLIFTCASTRTAQISTSTLLRGVSTNQAVVNIYGLQNEIASENYCRNSEAFSLWNQLGPQIPTFGLTDPAGNSTACSINTISGPYYSLYQTSTSPTSTIYSISIWTKSIGTGNNANFAITAAGGYGTTILIVEENNQSGLSTAGNWHYITNAATVASNTAIYTILPDTDEGTNSTYAFAQYELLPYSTSYIPATSRAASTLQGIFNNAANPVLDLTFIAAASAVAVGAITFISDGTSSIGLNSSGNLTYNFSGTKTGSNTYSWSAGDTVRVVVAANGTAGNVFFQLYKNGTLQNSETLSNGSSFTFSSKTLYLGSVGSTGQYLPAKGYSKIGII